MAQKLAARFPFVLALLAVAGCDASDIASLTQRTSEHVAPVSNSMTDVPPSSQVQADSNVLVVDPADVDAIHGPSPSQYPGKTIEVTSIVTDIGITGRSNSILTMKSGSSLGASVFSAQEREAWARIGPGQVVTLRSDRVENWWQIVNAGKNPCPILACADFAKEFQDSPLLAGDQYERRSLYLVGRVLEIDAKENPFFVVAKMESSDTVELRFAISKSSYSDYLKTLSVGQRICALCAFDKDRIDKTLSKLELVVQPITVPFPVAGVEYLKSMPSLAERAKENAAKIRKEDPDPKIDLSALIKAKADTFQKRPAQTERLKLIREGKVVEVSGFIRSFDVRHGRPQIILGNDRQEGGSIAIHMTETPWMRYTPEQWVTIRCRVRMLNLLQTLDDGVVMDAKDLPSPTREVTAVELVERLHESNDAVTSWRDTYIRLSGRILKRDANWGSGVFALEGGSGFSVRVFLKENEHARRKNLEKLAPGATVKVLGRVSDIDLGKKWLKVDNGWICDDET